MIISGKSNKDYKMIATTKDNFIVTIKSSDIILHNNNPLIMFLVEHNDGTESILSEDELTKNSYRFIINR